MFLSWFRTLYIEGERKLDFHGWVSAIQRAAGRSGDTLSQQQLTEADIPLIVERCIHYVTQYGKNNILTRMFSLEHVLSDEKDERN